MSAPEWFARRFLTGDAPPTSEADKPAPVEPEPVDDVGDEDE